MVLSRGISSKLSSIRLLSLGNWWLFSLLILNVLPLPSILRELKRDQLRARAVLSFREGTGHIQVEIKRGSFPVCVRHAARVQSSGVL